MTVVARVARIAGVGVVIVLALVTILTALRTDLPRSPGVMSDALGPDPGEPVAEYLDRAAASLAVGGDEPGGAAGGGDDNDDNHDNDDDNATSLDPEALRWALLSADQAWTAADADAVGRDLPRISGLTVQVPVDGVAMPVTEVALAEPVAGEESREAVFDRGLQRVADGLGAGAPTSTEPGADRAAAAAALTASRIRSGAPSIIGLLVRGTPAQLRAAAEVPGVRAVEALPADAVWGRFAVRPLQPQQIETAAPLPDSGPVPAS